MCTHNQPQQYTGAQLYDLCHRKGNFLFVDGKPTTARPLKGDKCLYFFDREEDRTATCRNIYVKTGSIQTRLF